jgi:hypothetical protein
MQDDIVVLASLIRDAAMNADDLKFHLRRNWAIHCSLE